MLNAVALRPLIWTSAAPLLCALHCVATPLVVLVAPSFAPDIRSEVAMLAGSAVLAAVASTIGIREHGSRVVLAPILVGLAIWALSLGGAFRPLPEAATTAMPSLLVAAGLLWNARLRHVAVCPGCGCRSCDNDAAVDGADD